MITIPIEVSARHIHLSQQDLDTLFGKNYQLTPIKKLSQHNQFACEEVVEVQTNETWGLPPHMDFTFGKAADHNQVRMLGPVREKTQIEFSWTDCISLGIKPHVAVSGDWENSGGGIIIVGPRGEINMKKGVIVPQRHIHANTQKAKEYGLKHGQIVSVRVIDDGVGKRTAREITFHNVIVRTHDAFDWQVHLDSDEGNAAGLKMHGMGEIIISLQL